MLPTYSLDQAYDGHYEIFKHSDGTTSIYPEYVLEGLEYTIRPDFTELWRRLDYTVSYTRCGSPDTADKRCFVFIAGTEYHTLKQQGFAGSPCLG